MFHIDKEQIKRKTYKQCIASVINNRVTEYY